MREILFRGQTEAQKKWVFGDLLHSRHGGLVWIDNHEDGAISDLRVIPETVGQFTGLTDKNGVKIFEGDIIQSHAHGNKNIVFNHEIKYGAFIPKGYCQAWYSDLYDFGFYAQYKNNQNMIPYDTSRIEVVGNIHDNPELLESD